MAIERLQYLIDAVWKGSPEAKKAAGEIRDVGDAGETTRNRLKNLAGGVSAASQAFGVISGGVAAAWKTLEQGAALELASTRFDRLAGSVGSTADAMLTRLREATNGMVSDAKLIESASGIISVGLQDNEDGVVRLATLVSELGWDMQQVILTFANNSKARLDSLGLSVSDVEARTQKFIQAGHSMDEAFDLAVIEAGEERLRLLGSAAGTMAGDMAKAEASIANVKDRTLEWLASASGPAIHQMVGGYAQDLQVMIDSQMATVTSTEDLIDIGQRLSKITGFQAWFTGTSGVVASSSATIVEKLAQVSSSAEEFQANVQAAFGDNTYIQELDLHTGAVGEVAAVYEEFKASSEAAAIATYEMRRAGIDTAETVAGPVASAFESAMGAVEAYTTTAQASADATYEMRREGIDSSEALRAKLVADYEEQIAKTEELEEATRELRQEFAGEFKSALEAGDTETQDFTGAMFDAAVQAGANEESLILLAAATGDYTEAQIEAALKTAAMRTKAEELGQAIADGTITVGDAIIELDNFQGKLSEDYIIAVDSEQAMLAEQRARQAKLAVEDLDGSRADVHVTTHFHQQGTPYSGPYDDMAPDYQHGTGGWLTVPPGYPNDSYRINMTSGERFAVVPAGQTMPAGGGAGTTVHIGRLFLPGVTDAQGFLEQLDNLAIGGIG